MPEISRFYGIVITMYFPDHNPPHFEWWEQHKDELWTNWKKMQNGETMFKIKPLIKHEEY